MLKKNDCTKLGTSKSGVTITIYRAGADGVKREVKSIGKVQKHEPVGVFKFK